TEPSGSTIGPSGNSSPVASTRSSDIAPSPSGLVVVLPVGHMHHGDAAAMPAIVVQPCATCQAARATGRLARRSYLFRGRLPGLALRLDLIERLPQGRDVGLERLNVAVCRLDPPHRRIELTLRVELSLGQRALEVVDVALQTAGAPLHG